MRRSHRLVPGAGSLSRSWILFLLMGLGAPTGCAKRVVLRPTELARVQTTAGVNPLRVYTSAKVITFYDETGVDENYQVQRQIRESSERARVKEIVTRDTAGLILAIEERNGAPLVWVTFDPACREKGCAYGFVQTEAQVYRLTDVPRRTGFSEPKSHRNCTSDKKLLKPGKMSSLAEANEVLLVKKPSGKVLTVDLEVKKVVDEAVRTRTRRQRGIE